MLLRWFAGAPAAAVHAMQRPGQMLQSRSRALRPFLKHKGLRGPLAHGRGAGRAAAWPQRAHLLRARLPDAHERVLRARAHNDAVWVELRARVPGLQALVCHLVGTRPSTQAQQHPCQAHPCPRTRSCMPSRATAAMLCRLHTPGRSSTSFRSRCANSCAVRACAAHR